jgi:hypothetical protein
MQNQRQTQKQMLAKIFGEHLPLQLHMEEVRSHSLSLYTRTHTLFSYVFMYVANFGSVQAISRTPEQSLGFGNSFKSRHQYRIFGLFKWSLRFFLTLFYTLLHSFSLAFLTHAYTFQILNIARHMLMFTQKWKRGVAINPLEDFRWLFVVVDICNFFNLTSILIFTNELVIKVAKFKRFRVDIKTIKVFILKRYS